MAWRHRARVWNRRAHAQPARQFSLSILDSQSTLLREGGLLMAAAVSRAVLAWCLVSGGVPEDKKTWWTCRLGLAKRLLVFGYCTRMQDAGLPPCVESGEGGEGGDFGQKRLVGICTTRRQTRQSGLCQVGEFVSRKAIRLMSWRGRISTPAASRVKQCITSLAGLIDDCQ